MKRRERFLCEVAKRFDCAVERTRRGHYRLRHADGWVVVTGSTPSNGRADANLIADLARASRRGAA